jgi:hypothetical protein
MVHEARRMKALLSQNAVHIPAHGSRAINEYPSIGSQAQWLTGLDRLYLTQQLAQSEIH